MRLLQLIFILICALPTAYAQTAEQQVSRPFACLHLHTSFKHYGREVMHPDSILSGWKVNQRRIREKYGRANWEDFEGDSEAFIHATSSKLRSYDQAAFPQLSKSPGSLVCTSIYPYEKQFALSRLKRAISHRFVTGHSMERLAVYGEDSSYPFKEFLAEYYFLVNQREQIDNGPRIVVARDSAHLEASLKTNAIVQVLTIEGGHVLYGPLCGSEDLVRLATATMDERAEIDRNIQALRTLPHKVFFITPAHFTDNKLVGFCKTIDREGIVRSALAGISQSVAMRESFFTKFGDGIHGHLDTGEEYVEVKQGDCMGMQLPYTEYRKDQDSLETKGYGYEVFAKLLAPDNPTDGSRRILIDVKHMDVKARFQYYEWIKGIYPGETIPIIASHVAMSGESRPVSMATGLYPFFDVYSELNDPNGFYAGEKEDDEYWHCFTSALHDTDRALYFNPNDPRRGRDSSFNPFKDYNRETVGWFYPWSINLADEEVAIIYESRGIIGLNFDPRVLGGSMPGYQNPEYKAKLDSEYKSLELQPKDSFDFETYWNCEPLLRNMFYIVRHCGVKDSTAWDRIAFGTDFDGLIAPLQECRTAAEMPQFFDKLASFVDIFWLLHKDEVSMWGEEDLRYNLSGKRIAEKVFFENARNFILAHF